MRAGWLHRGGTAVSGGGPGIFLCAAGGDQPHVEVKIDKPGSSYFDRSGSSTTRTISDWKAPTCFQCRKARTSTSSAWRSAEKRWTPNCCPRKRRAQIYEEIVRKMRDPALLEYAGRDLFKVRIFRSNRGAQADQNFLQRITAFGRRHVT